MDDFSILNVYRYMKPLRSYFDKPRQSLQQSTQPSASPQRPRRSQSTASGAKRSSQIVWKHDTPLPAGGRRSQTPQSSGHQKIETPSSSGTRRSQTLPQQSSQRKSLTPSQGTRRSQTLQQQSGQRKSLTPSQGTRKSQTQIQFVGQRKSQTLAPQSGPQKPRGPSPSGSRRSLPLSTGQVHTASHKSQSSPSANVQKPRQLSPTEWKRTTPPRATAEPVALPEKLSEALYPPTVQSRMTATSMIELRASRFSYVHDDHAHHSARMTNPERRLAHTKKEAASELSESGPTTEDLIGSLTHVNGETSPGAPHAANTEENFSATTPEVHSVSPTTSTMGATEATSSDEAQPHTSSDRRRSSVPNRHPRHEAESQANSSEARPSSVGIPKGHPRRGGCILFTRKNSILFPDRHLNFVHYFWSNVLTNIQTLYFMTNYFIPTYGFL